MYFIKSVFFSCSAFTLYAAASPVDRFPDISARDVPSNISARGSITHDLQARGGTNSKEKGPAQLAFPDEAGFTRLAEGPSPAEHEVPITCRPGRNQRLCEKECFCTLENTVLCTRLSQEEIVFFHQTKSPGQRLTEHAEKLRKLCTPICGCDESGVRMSGGGKMQEVDSSRDGSVRGGLPLAGRRKTGRSSAEFVVSGSIPSTSDEVFSGAASHGFPLHRRGNSVSNPEDSQEASGHTSSGEQAATPHRIIPIHCTGERQHWCEENCLCTSGGHVSCEKLSKAEIFTFKTLIVSPGKTLVEHSQFVKGICAPKCACQKEDGNQMRISQEFATESKEDWGGGGPRIEFGGFAPRPRSSSTSSSSSSDVSPQIPSPFKPRKPPLHPRGQAESSLRNHEEAQRASVGSSTSAQPSADKRLRKVPLAVACVGPKASWCEKRCSCLSLGSALESPVEMSCQMHSFGSHALAALTGKPRSEHEGEAMAECEHVCICEDSDRTGRFAGLAKKNWVKWNERDSQRKVYSEESSLPSSPATLSDHAVGAAGGTAGAFTSYPVSPKEPQPGITSRDISTNPDNIRSLNNRGIHPSKLHGATSGRSITAIICELPVKSLCESECRCTASSTVTCDKSFKQAGLEQLKNTGLLQHMKEMEKKCTLKCKCQREDPGAARRNHFQVAAFIQSMEAHKDSSVETVSEALTPGVSSGEGIHEALLSRDVSTDEAISLSLQPRGGGSSKVKYSPSEISFQIRSKKKYPARCKDKIPRPICEALCYCTHDGAYTCDKLTKAQKKLFASKSNPQQEIDDHAYLVREACVKNCGCWHMLSQPKSEDGVASPRRASLVATRPVRGFSGERSRESGSGRSTLSPSQSAPNLNTNEDPNAEQVINALTFHPVHIHRNAKRGGKSSKLTKSAPEAAGYHPLMPEHPSLRFKRPEEWEAGPIKCVSPWNEACQNACQCTPYGTVSCGELPNELKEAWRKDSDPKASQSSHVNLINEKCRPICACKDREGIYKIEGRTLEEWEHHVTKGSNYYGSTGSSGLSTSHRSSVHPRDAETDQATCPSSSTLERSAHKLLPRTEAHELPPSFPARVTQSTPPVAQTPVFAEQRACYPAFCITKVGRECGDLCHCTGDSELKCDVRHDDANKASKSSSSSTPHGDAEERLMQKCTRVCGCKGSDGLYRVQGMTRHELLMKLNQQKADKITAQKYLTAEKTVRFDRPAMPVSPFAVLSLSGPPFGGRLNKASSSSISSPFRVPPSEPTREFPDQSPSEPTRESYQVSPSNLVHLKPRGQIQSDVKFTSLERASHKALCIDKQKNQCELKCSCTSISTFECDLTPFEQSEKFSEHEEAKPTEKETWLKVCMPNCGCKDPHGVYRIQGHTIETIVQMNRLRLQHQMDRQDDKSSISFRNRFVPSSPFASQSVQKPDKGHIQMLPDLRINTRPLVLRHVHVPEVPLPPMSPLRITEASIPNPGLSRRSVASSLELSVDIPAAHKHLQSHGAGTVSDVFDPAPNPTLHRRGHARSTNKGASLLKLNVGNRNSRKLTIVCSNKRGEKSFCETRCYCTSTGTVSCGKRGNLSGGSALDEEGTEGCPDACWCETEGELTVGDRSKGSWGTWKLPGGGRRLLEGERPPLYPPKRPDYVIKAPLPLSVRPTGPILHPRGVWAGDRQKVECHGNGRQFCKAHCRCSALGTVVCSKKASLGISAWTRGSLEVLDDHESTDCAAACLCNMNGVRRKGGRTADEWKAIQNPGRRGRSAEEDSRIRLSSDIHPPAHFTPIEDNWRPESYPSSSPFHPMFDRQRLEPHSKALVRRGGAHSTENSATSPSTSQSTKTSKAKCNTNRGRFCERRCYCTAQGTLACDKRSLRGSVTPLMGSAARIRLAEQIEQIRVDCMPICGCKELDGNYRYAGRTIEELRAIKNEAVRAGKPRGGIGIRSDTEIQRPLHSSPERRGSGLSVEKSPTVTSPVSQAQNANYIQCSGEKAQYCKSRCYCTATGMVVCDEVFGPGQGSWLRGSMALTGENANKAFKERGEQVTAECSAACVCNLGDGFNFRGPKYKQWRMMKDDAHMGGPVDATPASSSSSDASTKALALVPSGTSSLLARSDRSASTNVQESGGSAASALSGNRSGTRLHFNPLTCRNSDNHCEDRCFCDPRGIVICDTGLLANNPHRLAYVTRIESTRSIYGERTGLLIESIRVQTQAMCQIICYCTKPPAKRQRLESTQGENTLPAPANQEPVGPHKTQHVRRIPDQRGGKAGEKEVVGGDTTKPCPQEAVSAINPHDHTVALVPRTRGDSPESAESSSKGSHYTTRFPTVCRGVKKDYCEARCWCSVDRQLVCATQPETVDKAIMDLVKSTSLQQQFAPLIHSHLVEQICKAQGNCDCNGSHNLGEPDAEWPGFGILGIDVGKAPRKYGGPDQESKRLKVDH